MSKKLDKVAARAAGEWDYDHAESQFNRDPLPVSIPCQLRFTDPPDQNTDRFHEALDVHGFNHLGTNPDRTIRGRVGEGTTPFYEGEVCSTDHYNRVKVLVFRGGVIRLFPKDDYVPDTDELAELLHALTVGFKAPLEHDPIEDDD